MAFSILGDCCRYVFSLWKSFFVVVGMVSVCDWMCFICDCFFFFFFFFLFFFFFFFFFFFLSFFFFFCAFYSPVVIPIPALKTK